MFLWFYSLPELDFNQLMAVYEEENRMSGAMRYPHKTAAMQMQLAQQDFEDYLRQIFFRQADAVYCILSENHSYISAARIEKTDAGYLLTALATRPEFRRKGYGKRLLQCIVDAYSKNGKLPIFSHIRNKNCASMQLHLQCGFSVCKDSARYLDGSVDTNSKTLIYKK